MRYRKMKYKIKISIFFSTLIHCICMRNRGMCFYKPFIKKKREKKTLWSLRHSTSPREKKQKKIAQCNIL